MSITFKPGQRVRVIDAHLGVLTLREQSRLGAIGTVHTTQYGTDDGEVRVEVGGYGYSPSRFALAPPAKFVISHSGQREYSTAEDAQAAIIERGLAGVCHVAEVVSSHRVIPQASARLEDA